MITRTRPQKAIRLSARVPSASYRFFTHPLSVASDLPENTTWLRGCYRGRGRAKRQSWIRCMSAGKPTIPRAFVLAPCSVLRAHVYYNIKSHARPLYVGTFTYIDSWPEAMFCGVRFEMLPVNRCHANRKKKRDTYSDGY